MTMWRAKIDRRAGPIYRALADAIERDVQDGSLVHGARLPTHRALARQLGVTAVTVTRGYGEAARRGLIESTVGKGTFVCAEGGPTWQSRSLDLARNLIFGNEQLALPRDFQSSLRSVLRDPTYQVPPGGNARHRTGGAQFIGQFGPPVDAERVLVTPGAQASLLVTLAALLRPGDPLMTEEMTYPGFRSAVTLLGIRPVELALDEEGLMPRSFDAACRKSGSKVLYCVPNFQNPTGVVMPEERRREIADIARRRAVTIIEDDVYSFIGAGALPLASLLPDQTCYFVSASKWISPALRLGFLAAPRALVPRLESSLAAAVAYASSTSANIFQLLLESGEAGRITAAKRALVIRHQEISRRIFGDALGATDARSPHSWLTLPPNVQAQDVVDEAAARGCAIAPATAFTFSREKAPNAVRISVGATADSAALQRALEMVAEIASGSYIPSPSVM